MGQWLQTSAFGERPLGGVCLARTPTSYVRNGHLETPLSTPPGVVVSPVFWGGYHFSDRKNQCLAVPQLGLINDPSPQVWGVAVPPPTWGGATPKQELGGIEWGRKPLRKALVRHVLGTNGPDGVNSFPPTLCRDVA